MEDPAAARRSFAIPPASGMFNDIDLSFLDPNDWDGRRTLIEAEHPELHEALRSDADEIAGPDGSPMSPRLHIAMHEIVANQLWDGDPPEVWETAERLRGLAYERHEILHMLAAVAGGNLWEMLKQKRLYDRDRYAAALAALPESWEQDRPRAASPRSSRSKKPRAKKGAKRGGRRRRR
jgi:hypothetical protein